MPTSKKDNKTSNIQNTVEYLENIVALMPGHVYWKDRNGVLLGCNDEQARSIGLKSRYDIVGLTAYDTLPKDLADAITRVDNEVMTTGIPQTVEEVLVLPNGEESIWLSKKVPLYNQKGDIVGILGVSFDITQQKRTEKELHAVRQKLEGMTLAGASIAHELRTPLASINMGVKNIKQVFPDLLYAYQLATKANLLTAEITPEYFQMLKAVLDSIESETKSAHAFTEILLMNINPTLGDTKKEVFSMVECINEALNRYPFKKGQRGIIHWDNSRYDFVVKGSSLFIIHVLFNLIKNALYYLAASGKPKNEIKIEIWLEPGNRLYFKDTGTGISADIVPHIFERFFSKTYRGTGIGLTFCKMVMESIGGTITCESVDGSYTQFIMTFPYETVNQ